MDTTAGMGLCTATLIDPEVLLTAGHCVYNREGDDLILDAVSDPSLLTIYNGAKISSSPSIAQATQVIKHPDWDGYLETLGYKDDLSLIKLDRRITELEIYGLRQEPQSEVGDTGVIVGYGVTSDTASDSGVHRWGTAEILEYWNSAFGKDLVVGNPSSGCFGDSGGPFFTVQNGRTVIEGVTSYGGDCSPEEGGHYMPTLAFMDFINEAFQSLTGHGLDQICGNGIRESGETCDGDSVDCGILGPYASGTSAPCNNDCSGYLTTVCNEVICGDGIREGTEICDRDSQSCDKFGDYADWLWAPCQSDCMGFDTTYCWDAAKATCGNGMLEGLEECDDGNLNDNDDCTASCKNAYCGDGIINTLREECDWAEKTYQGFFCTADCAKAFSDDQDENNSGSGGGCSLSTL